MKNNRFPFHSLLFALFPILFLYSHNIDQVSFTQIIIPVLLVLAASAVFYLIFLLLFRDGDKSGLFLSILLILFFSYGHILSVIGVWHFKNFHKPKHLIIAMTIFLALSVYFIIKRKKSIRKFISVLNVISLTLVVITIFNIGFNKFNMTRGVSGLNVAAGNPGQAKLEFSGPGTPPDIYYIIFDAYASSGILKEVYNYDNSEFIEYLQDKGFYVAQDSCSNYATTFLSLASSLNMRYVDDIAEEFGPQAEDRSIFYEMIRDNEVSRLLKSAGYKIIHFSSGWAGTAYNSNADIRFDCGIVDEFSLVLIRSTLLDSFVTQNLVRHDARRRIQKMFTSLADVADIEGPKFVFAHFICPHPPFLFDEDGGEIPGIELDFDGRMWTRRDLYLRQFKFANKNIRVLVDELSSRSKTPPVIIFQADHGTASIGRPHFPVVMTDNNKKSIIERLHIFNAYYLPDGRGDFLYSSISPVNSFRGIFNAYFGTDYELLEDKSTYSNYTEPYILTDVTDIVNSGEQLPFQP